MTIVLDRSGSTGVVVENVASCLRDALASVEAEQGDGPAVVPPVEGPLELAASPLREPLVRIATSESGAETAAGPRGDVVVRTPIGGVDVGARRECEIRRQLRAVRQVAAQSSINLVVFRIVEVGEAVDIPGRVRRRTFERERLKVEREPPPRHLHVARRDVRVMRVVPRPGPDAGRWPRAAETRRHVRIRIGGQGLRSEVERGAILREVLDATYDLEGRVEKSRFLAESGDAAVALAEFALCDRASTGERAGRLGDDVDGAEHRIGTIENRTGAEDDLDMIDELDGNAEAATQVRSAVQWLVDGVSVDQQRACARRCLRG